jgi:hypothetical protein
VLFTPGKLTALCVVLVAPFPLFPVHEASQSTLYVQQVATDGNSGTIISELRNAMDFKPCGKMD